MNKNNITIVALIVISFASVAFAFQQRQLASDYEKQAIENEKRAIENQAEAQRQTEIANQHRLLAERQRTIAEANVVEAMKMQNNLQSAKNGTVKAVFAKPGQSLAVDENIIEFE